MWPLYQINTQLLFVFFSSPFQPNPGTQNINLLQYHGLHSTAILCNTRVTFMLTPVIKSQEAGSMSHSQSPAAVSPGASNAFSTYCLLCPLTCSCPLLSARRCLIWKCADTFQVGGCPLEQTVPLFPRSHTNCLQTAYSMWRAGCKAIGDVRPCQLQQKLSFYLLAHPAVLIQNSTLLYITMHVRNRSDLHRRLVHDCETTSCVSLSCEGSSVNTLRTATYRTQSHCEKEK